VNIERKNLKQIQIEKVNRDFAHLNVLEIGDQKQLKAKNTLIGQMMQIENLTMVQTGIA